MKNGLIFSLLFFSIFGFGQSKSKIIRKTEIDVTLIEYIRIGKVLKKPIQIEDSTAYNLKYKRLDSDQTIYFVKEWNNSNYVGEKKLKPKYYIEVNFKDKSKKVIKLNGTLNEIKRFCF